jgi:hypothetical protein
MERLGPANAADVRTSGVDRAMDADFSKHPGRKLARDGAESARLLRPDQTHGARCADQEALIIQAGAAMTVRVRETRTRKAPRGDPNEAF